MDHDAASIARVKLALVAVLVALLAAVVIPAARADEPADPYASPAVCGQDDTPETGIQGDVPIADQQSSPTGSPRAEQGYNCGLALVGHKGFGVVSSSSLAWAGNCAYVQGDGGVRVVDVSDPTAPEQVGDLLLTGDGQPTGGGAENIYAVTAKGRAILIAARAGGNSLTNLLTPGAVDVDVYDVRNCKAPSYLGTITFPDGAHNIAVSPDATKVFVTMSLQYADITNLRDPSSWNASITNLQCEVVTQSHTAYKTVIPLCDATGGSPPQLSHEVEFNASGTRLYIGGQLPGLDEEFLHILDLTKSPVEVLGSLPGAGHGIRRATIDDREYLLHSDETAPGVPQPVERRANGCAPEQGTPFAGTAESYLTALTADGAQFTEERAKLGLAINRPEPEPCAAALQSAVNSTVHYNTVDSPDDTTFAMLSMKNAGLRVWDVRAPGKPTEVAYFNPGQYRSTDSGVPVVDTPEVESTVLDRTRMHTHYHASTGHIWMLSEVGGFWVLELEPQVRAALSLPGKEPLYPEGRPARPPELASTVAVRATSATAKDLLSYCSL